MGKKTEKNKDSKNKEVKISTIIYSALIVIVAIIIVLGVAIYAFGWDNGLIKKAEKFIPYPAAIVKNTNFITIGRLNANLNSVKKFYESQDFSEVNMRVDFSTENGKKRLKLKEKEILNKLIEDKAIEVIAKRREIKISNETVTQNLERKLEEYGNGEKLENDLERLYGWSTEDFKNKIVKPDLYKQELESLFDKENPTVSGAKSQIEKANDELNNKKLFADVAKKYSKGSTAQDGGELGWYKKNQLIYEISDTTFSLEKGKRSEILESPLGFHIVELEDKKTENGEDLVKIRQIFVPKKTFAEFLTEEMKKIKIIIPIRDYVWNEETQMLEFKNEDMKKFEQELINNSQGDASILF
jgi:parvulin-like peptidyl-prolyl isomerase